MPKLISLYIQQVAIGFAISAAFVAGLLFFDVAGLWRLVSGDSAGGIAVLMLWVANGVVFAGVQFGIRIMMMEWVDGFDLRQLTYPRCLMERLKWWALRPHPPA